MRAGAEPVPEPLAVYTTEEIGQVAHAVDELHTQALLLAGDEARLRLLVNDMFETMSRRSRSLVDQQLALIDRLERDEEDPERLDNLFRLDHLAARLRRTSANLLVLADAQIGRDQRDPVPLATVINAAVSEVEDYRRVETGAIPDCTVLGSAAGGVIHLLAELIDNALRYSPPNTKVKVSAVRGSEGGVLLRIADSGLGMTDSDRRMANMRLQPGGTPTRHRRMRGTWACSWWAGWRPGTACGWGCAGRRPANRAPAPPPRCTCRWRPWSKGSSSAHRHRLRSGSSSRSPARRPGGLRRTGGRARTDRRAVRHVAAAPQSRFQRHHRRAGRACPGRAAAGAGAVQAEAPATDTVVGEGIPVAAAAGAAAAAGQDRVGHVGLLRAAPVTEGTQAGREAGAGRQARRTAGPQAVGSRRRRRHLPADAVGNHGRPARLGAKPGPGLENGVGPRLDGRRRSRGTARRGTHRTRPADAHPGARLVPGAAEAAEKPANGGFHPDPDAVRASIGSHFSGVRSGRSQARHSSEQGAEQQ